MFFDIANTFIQIRVYKVTLTKFTPCRKVEVFQHGYITLLPYNFCGK